MDRLAAMGAFVKVVDLGGFAAAARATGLSTAMVSKHVAALERELGVSLLTRTTRRVAPTEAGRRYHVLCTDIVQAVQEADREVSVQAQQPVGCLRVTAPVEFGNLHIAPLLPRMLKDHPGLSVNLDLGNRVVDLVEEGLDAAVRIAAGFDTALRGRHLTSSNLMLVASPAYLDRHGSPRGPDDLHGHATLSFALGPGAAWPFEQGGRRAIVQVRPRFMSTSSEAVRLAACAGEGIGFLPTFLVAPQLASGELVPVLDDWSHGALKVYALYPARRSDPARLRAFIDVLVQRFGDDPQQDGFLPASLRRP